MTSSSIRLLLEEFLGLMREEGELDAFLPTVLVARNHEIVYRAQKGPRQYGVDIVSIEHTAFMPSVLCLWLVKCGNIGRSEWNGNSVQAIRPSMDEVETYIASNIRPEHHGLPIRLVIITNGDYLSSINQDMAAYLDRWKKRNNADAEIVNGSKLAAWVEFGLLDENVLTGANKSLFRRTLANVATPDLCLLSGRQLVDALLVGVNEIGAVSMSKRLKQQLVALRAIRTILSVLQFWSDDAGNLLAPYRLSEYAVLKVWATFHSEIAAENKTIIKEYWEIFSQMLFSARKYHNKLLPYYAIENAFASRFGDNLLIADSVFTELGRLGLQGCIWAFFETEYKEESPKVVQFYLNSTLSLIRSHPISALPPYDHHASSIHTVLLFLLVANEREVAKNWIFEILGRLKHVTQKIEYWPSATTFDDTLLARHGLQVSPPEASHVTTLLPLLLIWSAALKMENVYHFIKDKIIPAVPHTTLNVWNSDTGFDSFVASPGDLHEHGVGEALAEIPEHPEKFLQLMTIPLDGVESIEQTVWFQARCAYIPILSAQYWHLQMPREMLAKHIAAVCEPFEDQYFPEI